MFPMIFNYNYMKNICNFGKPRSIAKNLPKANTDVQVYMYGNSTHCSQPERDQHTN